MGWNIQMFKNNNQDEFLVRDIFMKNSNATAEIIQPQYDIRKFYHTFFVHTALLLRLLHSFSSSSVELSKTSDTNDEMLVLTWA